MKHLRLSQIRLVKLQIIVCPGADILHMLHIVVHTLDNMMTGRTERHQILALFLRIV